MRNPRRRLVDIMLIRASSTVHGQTVTADGEDVAADVIATF